jgi:hypothetical protein
MQNWIATTARATASAAAFVLAANCCAAGDPIAGPSKEGTSATLTVEKPRGAAENPLLELPRFRGQSCA